MVSARRPAGYFAASADDAIATSSRLPMYSGVR
jgi:hypothetical protein